MYFSIALILLIGIVAYFHYVQGLFSGILSAASALLAAALAMSLFEPLNAMLLKGKVADSSSGMLLIVLFVLIYLILRTIFDNLVPGNVRLPAIVDRVGGAICGIVAGLCGMGIVAITAQLLPFGPSIAGYARYELTPSRDVKVPTRGQYQDTTVNDEVKSDTFPPENAQAMYVPADDFVVGLVNHLSEGGALEGDRTLKSIHPAFLDELFYQRLGVQVGSKHVLFNTAKQKLVELEGAFAIDGVGQISAEIEQIRPRDMKSPVLKSDAGHQLVVMRLKFNSNASDSDHVIRLSPGSMRVVADYEEFHPIGTLENGVLAANRIDDFIFVDQEKSADFVFNLPVETANQKGAVVLKGGAMPPAVAGKPAAPAATGGTVTFKDGSFLEVKRLVRFNLTDTKVGTSLPGDADGVLRKADLKFAPKPGDPVPKMNGAEPTEEPAAAAPAVPAGGSADTPITFGAIKVSSSLGFTINVGQHDGDSGDAKFNSGTATLKEKKIVKLDVRPNDALTDLQKGDYPAGDFEVPSGTKLVQVTATVSDWTWATDLGSFELIDASGGKYTPNGAWAKVTKSSTERMVGKYDSENSVASIDKDEAIPTDVTILFLIPDNTQLKTLDFKGKKIADAVLSVE